MPKHMAQRKSEWQLAIPCLRTKSTLMAVCFQGIMLADLYGYSMKDTFAEGDNMCSDTVRMYNFENDLTMRSGRALDHFMYEMRRNKNKIDNAYIFKSSWCSWDL